MSHPNADLRTVSVRQQDQTIEPFRPPYVESYRRGSDELRFIAVAHEGGWGPTHITIDKAWAEFRPAAVIIEGITSAEGKGFAGILDSRLKLCATLSSKKCDEGSYAMLLSTKSKIPFLGGEPTEVEIKERALAAGYDLDDILGFYVIRQIPEWKRDGTYDEKNLPATVDRFIQYYAGVFGESTGFNWSLLKGWFKRKTGKELVPGEITTDDPAPISGPGTTKINSISRTVEIIRNEHLVSKIAKVLAKYHRVMIVYGQGHLKEVRPTLRAMLGQATESKQYGEDR